MNGNLSTAISLPSSSPISAATITSAPSTASAVGNVTCPQCQVVARYGPLSMALWWTSSINLTLDTVSVLVTKYNNTAVTRTTTIHKELSSVNASTMSDVQSSVFYALEAVDPEYEANGFALNNGTNAFTDGTFSVAYPTPFVGIQGFNYISVTSQDSQCPKGLQYGGQNLGTAECACMMQTYMDNPDLLDNTITSQITLSSTYYELGDTQVAGNNDLDSIRIEGPIPINNVSYSSFIESVLGSEAFNKYRSCVFLDVGFGPPALMIPVSALTATTTATVQSAGSYGSPSPKPGNPVTPIVPPPTSNPVTPPVVPIVKPEPEKEPPSTTSTTPYVAPYSVTPVAEPPAPIVNKPSPTQLAANSPVDEPIEPGSQTPEASPTDSSGTANTGNKGDQSATGPSDNGNSGNSDTGPQPAAGPQSAKANVDNPDRGDSKPSPTPVLAISYAGSSISPDPSSHYDIPQVGKLSPGGSPVTTNNVVYALAPSASALVSNGNTIPIPVVTAAAAPDAVEPIASPALTFAGSTYTADAKSRIVIAGQTVVPGGPAVTVSDTAISIAPDASVAVVGGSTQSLLHPTVPTPHPRPAALTFAGSIYTADS